MAIGPAHLRYCFVPATRGITSACRSGRAGPPKYSVLLEPGFNAGPDLPGRGRAARAAPAAALLCRARRHPQAALRQPAVRGAAGHVIKRVLPGRVGERCVPPGRAGSVRMAAQAKKPTQGGIPRPLIDSTCGACGSWGLSCGHAAPASAPARMRIKPRLPYCRTRPAGGTSSTPTATSTCSPSPPWPKRVGTENPSLR